MTPERMEWVANMFERLGSGVLLFASIPLFGQLLTAIGGAGKASRATFVVFVAISYLVRNWFIVILSEQIVNAFL
jgi:membrane protein YqaA with SNARE-associated domain